MSADDDRTCAATGCTHRPDPILCGPHGRQLGDMLADIGALWQRLDPTPSMQAREPGTGRSSGLTSERSPARLDVIGLRDPRTPADPDTRQLSVLATLAGWAEQVRDERGLVPATAEFRVRRDDRHIGPHCQTACNHGSCAALTFLVAYRIPPTVASERKLLVDHLDRWIVQQDWAGDFYDEIHKTWSLLKSANDPGPAIPRPRARPCPDGCGGLVKLTSGTDGKPFAACDRCNYERRGLTVAEIGGTAA